MRTFKIIGLAGFALLGVSSILVAKSAMAIEKAKYTVLDKKDGFEIRQYDRQIVAETFVEGDLEKAGNEKNKALLQELIQKRGLTTAGEPVWARYDPPFMPWFLRRNEVLISIEKF